MHAGRNSLPITLDFHSKQTNKQTLELPKNEETDSRISFRKWQQNLMVYDVVDSVPNKPNSQSIRKKFTSNDLELLRKNKDLDSSCRSACTYFLKAPRWWAFGNIFNCWVLSHRCWCMVNLLDPATGVVLTLSQVFIHCGTKWDVTPAPSPSPALVRALVTGSNQDSHVKCCMESVISVGALTSRAVWHLGAAVLRSSDSHRLQDG